MSESSKVLILGAGGLLGSCLVRTLSRETTHQFHAQTSERFNKRTEIDAYLSSSHPSLVVNCIAYKGQDDSKHYAVNGCLPRAIADWCSLRRIGLIQVSTNAVFAPDESRHWLPTDTPSPMTAYENAKLYGEDPRAHIIRTSFIGVSAGTHSGVLDALLAGEPFWDRRWNGVTALTLARHIIGLIDHPGHMATLEHVHGPSVVLFSDIAKMLGSKSRVLGYRPDARLLGGGAPTTPFREQLAELLDADS
jgi:dTDP-4-dehydrorhamnose reductase